MKQPAEGQNQIDGTNETRAAAAGSGSGSWMGWMMEVMVLLMAVMGFGDGRGRLRGQLVSWTKELVEGLQILRRRVKCSRCRVVLGMVDGDGDGDGNAMGAVQAAEGA